MVEAKMLLILATFGVVVNAFVPSIHVPALRPNIFSSSPPTTGAYRQTLSHPSFKSVSNHLSFQSDRNIVSEGTDIITEPIPIIKKHNDAGNLNEDVPITSISIPSAPTSQPRIVLPPSSEASKTLTKQNEKNGNGVKLHEKQTNQRWLSRAGIRFRWKAFVESLIRPGMKFRVRLGLVTLLSASVTTLLLPSRTRLLSLIKTWLKARGFQGIAALGRSAAYGWALLVGYPRMLDRRAAEARRRDQEKKLERRRTFLRSLAGEVSRLRQDLAGLDTEIRAFRREMIALKAYAKDDNPEVQEAIGAEMAQLAQLRSDTQAALAAARQAYFEARSKSPPETWDDILVEHTTL